MVQEGRLADARLAADDQDRTLAAADVLQQPVEQLTLVGSAEQDRGAVGGHSGFSVEDQVCGPGIPGRDAGRSRPGFLCGQAPNGPDVDRRRGDCHRWLVRGRARARAEAREQRLRRGGGLPARPARRRGRSRGDPRHGRRGGRRPRRRRRIGRRRVTCVMAGRSSTLAAPRPSHPSSPASCVPATSRSTGSRRGWSLRAPGTTSPISSRSWTGGDGARGPDHPASVRARSQDVASRSSATRPQSASSTPAATESWSVAS